MEFDALSINGTYVAISTKCRRTNARRIHAFRRVTAVARTDKPISFWILTLIMRPPKRVPVTAAPPPQSAAHEGDVALDECSGTSMRRRPTPEDDKKAFASDALSVRMGTTSAAPKTVPLHPPRSLHRPLAVVEGNVAKNLNKTGVRLWADLPWSSESQERVSP